MKTTHYYLTKIKGLLTGRDFPLIDSQKMKWKSNDGSIIDSIQTLMAGFQANVFKPTEVVVVKNEIDHGVEMKFSIGDLIAGPETKFSHYEKIEKFLPLVNHGVINSVVAITRSQKLLLDTARHISDDPSFQVRRKQHVSRKESKDELSPISQKDFDKIMSWIFEEEKAVQKAMKEASESLIYGSEKHPLNKYFCGCDPYDKAPAAHLMIIKDVPAQAHAEPRGTTITTEGLKKTFEELWNTIPSYSPDSFVFVDYSKIKLPLFDEKEERKSPFCSNERFDYLVNLLKDINKPFPVDPSVPKEKEIVPMKKMQVTVKWYDLDQFDFTDSLSLFESEEYKRFINQYFPGFKFEFDIPKKEPLPHCVGIATEKPKPWVAGYEDRYCANSLFDDKKAGSYQHITTNKFNGDQLKAEDKTEVKVTVKKTYSTTDKIFSYDDIINMDEAGLFQTFLGNVKISQKTLDAEFYKRDGTFDQKVCF